MSRKASWDSAERVLWGFSLPCGHWKAFQNKVFCTKRLSAIDVYQPPSLSREGTLRSSGDGCVLCLGGVIPCSMIRHRYKRLSEMDMLVV